VTSRTLAVAVWETFLAFTSEWASPVLEYHGHLLSFEDVFCAASFIVAFGMNRDKDATFLYFSFITLGFILRDARPTKAPVSPPTPAPMAHRLTLP